MFRVPVSSPCFTHYARYLNIKNQRVWDSIRNEFFSFSASVYIRVQRGGYCAICIKHPSGWNYADRVSQTFFLHAPKGSNKYPQGDIILKRFECRRELLKSPTKNERRENL